ncbi:MAG: PEP-CTERM sorting domain-containing protein [Verrucomicrobiae bacterium]|nr:PEP-CTERM sorting domain-containing protein [Verrucomicrobiae bacterium]
MSAIALLAALLGSGAFVAQAAVVYSGPLDIDIDRFDAPTISIDLNGGGNDFHFFVDELPDGASQNVEVTGAIPHLILIANVAENTVIGPDTTGYASSGALGFWEESPPSTGGPFLATRGFLPIALNTGTPGDYQFGWIDYSVAPDANTATIHGWAYNTDVNATILAGQVPEPATAAVAFALIGLGVAGVRQWRRRQS